MSDFNVKMTVRSARILAAIKDKFGSQAEMARQTGIGMHQVNAFVTLRALPVGLKGWTGAAETFASALGAYPSDLWPDHMRDVKLKRATAELSLGLEQVLAIAADDTNAGLGDLLGKASSGISERYLTAVAMNNAGATLDEVGDHLGVTRERARQIITKGMRQMRGKLERLGVRELSDAIDA